MWGLLRALVGGQGLLEAQWLGFSLASSFPELPDFSLTFSCLPASTFQAMSPPNPKLLSDPQGTAVPSSSVSWSPAEVPPSPGWPGQGAGQMGQDTHCQPGSGIWAGRRGCRCGSWSCAGRPVFGCPSPTAPPAPAPPLHRQTPSGARGQEWTEAPSVSWAETGCPVSSLLQPWMPPPRGGPERQGPGGREVGKVLGRRDTERPSGLVLPPSPSNNGCAAGQRGGASSSCRGLFSESFSLGSLPEGFQPDNPTEGFQSRVSSVWGTQPGSPSVCRASVWILCGGLGLQGP